MKDIALGIAILIIVVVALYLSFRLFLRNKDRTALIMLIVSGLLLRIFVSTDFYIHKWDERYHALVAKNMMSHPFKPTLYEHPLLEYDYKNWTTNHIWLHKQPMPLWVMAGSMSLFGVNEIAFRIPSILLSLIGIVLMFSVGRYFGNRLTGFLSAFLYAIHGLIIELAGGRVATDHIDIFFLFFIQLAIYLSIRFIETKRSLFNLMCGLAIGCAILTKWLPALIVLPIWLILVYGSRSFPLKRIAGEFVMLLLAMILIALPWQIYIHLAFSKEALWEGAFNNSHLFSEIEGHGKPLLYHFDKIRILYGELIYLPLIWILWNTIRKRMDFNRLALVVWIFVPLLFFTLAKTKMQAYTLFVAPAFFIITSQFFVYLYRNNTLFYYRWIGFLVLVLLILLPFRFSIERCKIFQVVERKPAWVVELKSFNINIINEQTVIFNYSRPIEAMFYTKAVAYESIPDSLTIINLQRKGYKIFIVEKENVTSLVKSIPGIILIRLSE